jgi:periplasmic protein TonB
MQAAAFPRSVAGPRLVPLGLIILLHAALLWTAMQAMTRPPAVPAPAREVVAMLITPQPAAKPEAQPAPLVPKPAVRPKPKAAPVEKKAVPRPTPKPAPIPAPAEKSITAPEPAAPHEPQAAAPTAAPAAPVEPAAPAASAPPAPPAPAMPKTVSGVEYVQPPRPEYPATSRRMNEEGKVMLRVLVNERGRPEQAEVQKSSGYSRLDEAARQAAMRAVFKPHAEDGKPVAVYALIPINFSIQ